MPTSCTDRHVGHEQDSTKGKTVIFSRDRGSGRHAADQSHRSGRPSGGSAQRDRRPSAAPEEDASQPRARSRRPDPDDAPSGGPYDMADAPDGVDRLDLGSLRIPVVEGVAVQVQANNDGVVQQVALTYADSALLLSALAAPRGEPVWDEVRAEIRKELSASGARAEELDGVYGPELRARVNTPDGAVDVRFVGVDGERWMVRAIYQGRAATDPAAAGPLDDCLAGLVVDRGRDAMPALEALPLRLPREIAEQARAQAEANAPAPNATNA